jgi:hypothetical protein
MMRVGADRFAGTPVEHTPAVAYGQRASLMPVRVPQQMPGTQHVTAFGDLERPKQPRGQNPPDDRRRQRCPIGISEFTGIGVVEHNDFGFDHPGGTLFVCRRAGVEQVREGFRGELTVPRDVDFTVGHPRVSRVAVTDLLGVRGQHRFDDQREFADELAVEMQGPVEPGGERQMIVRRVRRGVVAAVDVEAFRDAAHRTGPVIERRDRREVNKFGNNLGEQPGDTRVRGAEEHFDVVPGDITASQRGVEVGELDDQAA